MNATGDASMMTTYSTVSIGKKKYLACEDGREIVVAVVAIEGEREVSPVSAEAKNWSVMPIEAPAAVAN